YEDLRVASAERVASAPVAGVAVGGSLGQEKEQMREVVEWALRPAPPEKPRHLLGIGDVDDILASVAAGIDTFDCATPTRLARHGSALVPDPEARWRLDLAKSRWRDSHEPRSACPRLLAALARTFPARDRRRVGLRRSQRRTSGGQRLGGVRVVDELSPGHGERLSGRGVLAADAGVYRRSHVERGCVAVGGIALERDPDRAVE